MPFHARNAYYLRISQKHVLPLYVYLDERHLDWMSDLVLQHVVADLRPRILEKLRVENDSKKTTGGKGTVDTHRGDNYQFCYFLRKTEPHSVVMKTRLFKAAPPRQKAMGAPSVPIPKAPPKSRRRKRAKSDSLLNSQDPPLEKQRSKRIKPTTVSEDLTMDSPDEHDDDDDRDEGDYRPSSGSSDEDLIPTNRMAKGKKRQQAKRKRDDPMDEDETDVVHEVTLAVEEDEEKPKPILDLKYRGFNIFGLCLCVVVEPWPHFQYSMAGRAPSVAPVFQRQNETLGGPSSLRQGTPLFLPDESEQDEITPQTREAQPHPLFSEMTSFDDDDDDDIGGGGMMAFSQVLTTTGDYRGGIDDDENMTDVLFGDADEQREI
ncbi:hypothetical protein EYR38_005693 [Pleurotus pulmonarius]|nr:hypothetical protein EYR38_005693 [Pleurotus pulmonarius]